MEPLTESLPQAIVQTTCYIVGRQAGIEMLTEIYLFSSALSAISICKSMLVIAWRVFWAGSWKDVSGAADCCTAGWLHWQTSGMCAIHIPGTGSLCAYRHKSTMSFFLLASRTGASPKAPTVSQLS